jgi:hypothetical protein
MTLTTPRLTFRLAPQDEFPHDPGDAKNYNESMYFNVFDPEKKVGGWFRIGNRPNEGYAEISVCLYLPDGRVAFMFERPKINSNAKLSAGGLTVEVIEPFKRLKVAYFGKALVLARPFDMADPRRAYKENPSMSCAVDLNFEGVSPMYGGETVLTDGGEIKVDPEKSFAKAHYEQHCAAAGSFRIGDETFKVSGFGLRDKSWGPRHWQAIDWYRWCPMNFGRDFGMMLSVIGNGDEAPRQGGMVFRDGAYDLINECRIKTEWDEHGYQKAFVAEIKTEGGRKYTIAARVMSLIPLRNRRTTDGGEALETRITEGMTEYCCDGQTGYGLSEYLDQMVDGSPTGKQAGF